MLCLEAEQKCGCEVLDILDTDFGDIAVRIPGVQITVGQSYEEPDHGEDEPGEVEGGAEPEQGPRPGQVYHRGKEVFQVSVKHNEDLRDCHEYIKKQACRVWVDF